MNMEVYGTSSSCEAVGGVYSLAVNNRYRKVRISFLERSFVWQIWKPEYKAILRVETLNHKNEAEFSGLLIRTSAGWTLGLLNVNNTHPYPTISFETSAGVAFEKYFQFQDDDQSGISFHPLKFNRDRTKASADGIELSYLDYESGKDFFELHSNPFDYDPPAVFLIQIPKKWVLISVRSMSLEFQIKCTKCSLILYLRRPRRVSNILKCWISCMSNHSKSLEGIWG